MDQKEGRYKEIDMALGKELKTILNVEDEIEEIIRFANEPQNAGGLQLIFPFVYHDLMVKA
jgi:hypothetical protein